MSEPMDKREEVELPAVDEFMDAPHHAHEIAEEVIALLEDKLKAALAANCAKDAEIASLRASVGGEKWKSIESAPKDQSVFLGRKGNIIYMTQSSKSYVKWPHQEGGPTFRDEWNMIEYDAVSPWSPTHWTEIDALAAPPTLPTEKE